MTIGGEAMPKRALITGITGQDGSYLAEYLLARDTRSGGWSGASPTPVSAGSASYSARSGWSAVTCWTRGA